MKPTDNGPLVVLRLPRANLVLIAFATSVHDALEGNASFPNPNPTLAVFAQHIDDYAKAQALTTTRAKGAAKLRNAKKQKVVQDLRHIRDYVQGVIETQTSAVDAKAMAASAGLGTKDFGKPFKPVLDAVNGEISGMVYVKAKAVAVNATYYWQYSVDQKSWTNVPEVMLATTSITGLTSATLYYFRFRSLTRAEGMSDWSQVVSVVVH